MTQSEEVSMDMLEDEETSLESLDGQEDSSEAGGELEDQDQQIASEAEPVAPQFTHPHLQGKTPQEIESLFNLMQNTVQSQTRRINELATEAPRRQEVAEEPVPAGDFFDDPLTHLRREMQAVVAPINEEIANLKAQTRVNSAWESAQMKFADLDKYRPYIEQMLANTNVNVSQVTPELIESYYYGAKGYVATHQQQVAQPTAPAQSQPRMAPPQHRPSSAPLPKTGSAPRELTEDERRLAREWGMSAEEFLKWGSMDEGAVASEGASNA
jgi:hypothetical protein